ncbi:hypothetical protein LWC33_22070 [Pseudonocardia sp. RS11V-5]|uniref:hypothetical protein n=1 Tax=Pseudonocardia terrae TaxID=2905831 RepID=UPI001E50AD63|nr:hypothetical protein [Pseudonocardia terrae]MCE3554125.1 hypothetical protein [Pseudonocardia terrae]
MEPVDRTVDVDGRTRLALRHDGAERDRDLLIDVDSGHYAGERDVVTGYAGPLPAGTITATSSVLTAVVDEPGVLPPGFDAPSRTGTPHDDRGST